MTALVMVNNIRSPNFPDVPTLEETGYTGPPSRSWYGLFTPAGTPKPIVDKLAKEVAAIVNDPAFRGAPSHRPQPGAGDQHAGAVRRGDQEGSGDGRAGGQGGGADAAVTAIEMSLHAEMVGYASGFAHPTTSCGSAGAAATPARAQDYPSRPIRVIATSSAGGTSDIFMRALGEELHRRLGQPIIVENRPGGAFNIGARACAEAAPDGYTICIIPGRAAGVQPIHVQDPALRPGHRLRADHAAVLHHPGPRGERQAQRQVAAELAALVEGQAGTLSYSSAAIPAVVFIERWKKETGADLVKVPFRGGGEAVAALLTGATPVGFYGIANMRPQLEAGSVLGLAVDSDARSPLFPDIPTVLEASGRKYPPSPISA